MKIPNKVVRVALAEKKSLSDRGLKMCEEAGELAAEILRYQGLKGAKGKTKEEILYMLHLEAVDCLLMSMDILVKTGATEKRIRKIMDSQLKKWAKGIEK